MTAPDLDAIADNYAGAVAYGADGLADWWAEKLDAADAALRDRLRDPGLLADSAAYYAGLGLPIFPLTPGSKIPLPGSWTCCGGSHRRGCTDALAHVGAARAWWRQHPTANIGLATGHRVDVIDQDGTEGAVQWCRGANWPPVVGVVSTPRPGGVHRFIKATGYGNGARIAPGMDYRGRGGFVVLPPSYVATEKYAGRYTWLRGLDLRGC